MQINQNEKSKGKSISQISLFVVIIIISSFIKIPLPLVPITLQMPVCILAGLLLGCKGCISVLVYLFLGLLGLPVFSGGGGFSYLLYPTFGYMIGFILSSFVVGFLISKLKRRGEVKVHMYLIASIIGVIIVYMCGLPYFYLIQNIYLHCNTSVSKLLVYGFLVFLPTDFICSILISTLAYKLDKKIKLA